MKPRDEVLPMVYVQPGESHLLSKPVVLRTVLGSCVGVTFWSPRLGLAALCHPMMPRHPGHTSTKANVAESRRYVDFAIQEMARQFLTLGALRHEVEVKIFGGGDVLPVINPGARPTVGKLNCEAAVEVLGDEGLSIAASRLGGNCGINIQFDSRTGEVLLRRLS